jgi:hypothetical protein
MLRTMSTIYSIQERPYRECHEKLVLHHLTFRDNKIDFHHISVAVWQCTEVIVGPWITQFRVSFCLESEVVTSIYFEERF